MEETWETVTTSKGHFPAMTMEEFYGFHEVDSLSSSFRNVTTSITIDVLYCSNSQSSALKVVFCLPSVAIHNVF